MHCRNKHIDIQHHFLCDHVLKGYVEVTLMDTHNQLADILTKSLAKEPVFKIQRKFGILNEHDV